MQRVWKPARGWLAWVLLTSIGAGLYVAPSVTAESAAPFDGLRPLANAAQALVLPGWVAARVISHFVHLGPVAVAFVANAVGWGLWWGFIRLLLLVRARIAVGPGSAGLAMPSRRRLLLDVPIGLVGIGGLGGVAMGAGWEPWQLVVRQYTVPIADLPRALDGLRLVQISDTHLGPRIPASFIRSAVGLALELKPDAFVLTGDYIHNGSRFIDRAAGLFCPLVETGRPVVGVLGNHDWYGDGIAMSAAMRRVGVEMIDNARVFLQGSRRLTRVASGEALCIAGLGDLLEAEVDAEAALGGVAATMPRLVLAHHPDTAELSSLAGDGAPRVDLMFSGHTHGGQVRLPLIGAAIIPSRYGQRYEGGVSQGPRFPVVVSRGIGMSLIPVRLGVPPEVVEVTLVRA